jgi:hypothetical protein
VLWIKILLLTVMRKNSCSEWEYNETVHQLFVDLKRAYDSVRREVLYIILIEFAVPMKLVTLIKVYLNETCSEVTYR